MIYVKQDEAVVPDKVMLVAKRAQQILEALPQDERNRFINSKSHIWKAFKRYLLEMSYDKCWYSEAKGSQSFFDVDHFRPKCEAERDGGITDDGYSWLAFSWENFRCAAQRSNQSSKNEDTDETEGKGSKFPLLANSPRASWDNRCEASERRVFLDPTDRDDIQLLDVAADGRVIPSRLCVGTNKERVLRSNKIFGLNLPRLKAARLRAMRDIQNYCELILLGLADAEQSADYADRFPLLKLRSMISEKTHPREPYVAAVRAQLRLMGLGSLCLTPEEM